MRTRSPSVREFGKLFERALTVGDANLLESAANELDSWRLGKAHFPEDSFKLILDIINRPEFLKMKGAWPLLSIFRDNREALSEEQEKRLLAVIEHIYPGFEDSMGWFTICEFLGRDLKNDRALTVLGRLAKMEAVGPRSYVPHGLEHIIRDSDDRTLMYKAATLLLQMRLDSSKRVRSEARGCIRGLAAGGIRISTILREHGV